MAEKNFEGSSMGAYRERERVREREREPQGVSIRYTRTAREEEKVRSRCLVYTGYPL